MHNFENLEIWKRSMDVAVRSHVVAGDLPRNQRYGLTEQIYRSATSVPSNIAEGSAKRTAKEFRRFLRIALGSASELETQIAIAERMTYIDMTDAQELRADIKQVRRMIVGFNHTLVDQPDDPIRS